ncbi:2OG-Fe(II) oxygenase [Gammaproteobacteria bacterium]|jgi:SM-20-related protein|nr:2OG-Fe(II) oxygenase [Gammaproteobacteria bacterium]
MSRLLDLKAVSAAKINEAPYPYFTVERSVSDEFVEEVLHDFPKITSGGSFALSEVTPGARFNELLEELNGSAFRDIISEKLQLDLHDRPMVITLRGISRAKDGRIHTDSKSKMATILIYFNEPWTAESGKLRVLESENMDDYVTEIAPDAGAMIAFKVTENCWHGYPAFEGTRQSIQINFVEDDKAANKHGRRHGWTAKLKKLIS